MMMPLRKATKVIYIVQFVYCGSVNLNRRNIAWNFFFGLAAKCSNTRDNCLLT